MLRVGKVGVRYILSHISKAQFSRCLTDESSFFSHFFSFFENSQKVDSLTLSDKIVCKSEWVARHTEGGAKMGKKVTSRPLRDSVIHKEKFSVFTTEQILRYKL